VRGIIACVLLAACAHPAPPPDIQAASHALLEAWDHGDHAAVERALAPGFVHVENSSTLDRAAQLERLGKPHPKRWIDRREWMKQQVITQGDTAVFVGEVKEHDNGGHGGYAYEGTYILQWRRVADAWKLAMWVWRDGGAPAEAASWDRIFKNDTGFVHEPNGTLVAAVAGMTPGTALDLATGQGRNGLYLAEHGWHVTGVDISAEGLRHAAKVAKQRGLAFETVNENVDTYDFGEGRWNAITMIYAGDDPTWLARIPKALAPGGLFVAEYFARPKGGTEGLDLDVLKQAFAGFEILRAEQVHAMPDWRDDDPTDIVRFVARKR
jgi:SAM-dependent methyltransferase